MSQQLVMTKAERDALLKERDKVRDKLRAKGIDIVPVEIKGGLFTLPPEVLDDVRLEPLYELFAQMAVMDITAEDLLPV